MDYSATNPNGDSDTHNCDYCNAKIEVRYVIQTGHNEKEEYNCPECNKLFHSKASLPIQQHDVKLLSPRTDGKTDKFKNS